MQKILFFDGYCVLCNSLVDKMLRWDKNSRLKFAPIQGQTAGQLLKPNCQNQTNPDTVIYLRSHIVHKRSTAILLSLYDMGGLKTCAIVFFLVPRCLRDWIYRLIVKRRYQVFGKQDTCRLPKHGELERLLP